MVEYRCATGYLSLNTSAYLIINLFKND